MFRRILFWSHLSAGVACGLVILMMSVTGVLLAYERQIVARAELPMRHEPSAAALPPPLPVELLLGRIASRDAGFAATSVTVASDPLLPALVSAGRSGRYFIDRYDGTVLTDSAAGTRGFFDTITAWHRWFDADEDSRPLARAITGASNLAFLFLLLSGAYLWLPPIFNRVAFRTRWRFNPRVDNSKARDYNWHHVFGVWSLLPLGLVVASALVFSYDWANTLLYRAVRDTPPDRSAGPERTSDSGHPAPGVSPDRPELARFIAAAAAASPEWTSLTLVLPAPVDDAIRVSVDWGSGGQPQRRSTLLLDAGTTELIGTEPFSSLSPRRRARSWVRFLHTGEALGLAGQTAAGLVSLTSVIMVWTGIALAWRRLVSPVLRRRKKVSERKKGSEYIFEENVL
jgi:uncharacterized iron-regulated membrane protein